MRSTLLGILVNLVQSAAKFSAGFVDHSFALLADGLESGADVLSGLVVFFGLKIAVKPAGKDRHCSRVVNSTPHLTSGFVFRSGN
jgi:divalent metal cation (Fe/Co/Zn/Cd) transporter